MPRSSEQFAIMRQVTREKILDAAIRSFTRRGFAATSIQDIATEASISTGLVYRHFASKDELFGALVQQAASGLHDVAQLFAQDVPPQLLLRQFTDEIVADLEANDDFGRFMILITQAFMSEDFVPQVKELVKQNRALIKATIRLIERGQASGVFKSGNPEAMALYYFSTIQGLAETKFVLKHKFVAPTSEMILTFLIKE